MVFVRSAFSVESILLSAFSLSCSVFDPWAIYIALSFDMFQITNMNPNWEIGIIASTTT
jgi:hypothetical protein